MNERIKELIKQATTIEEHKWGVSYDNFDKEKFAELIVRECIDWCNAHARDDGTAQRIAEDIKKDFGVEE
jgi:endonuclease IV